MTTAFFRTVILYFILMVGLRLMGKRQIGELEPLPGYEPLDDSSKVTVDSSTVTLEDIENAKTQIVISKVDSVTGKELTGAKLEIRDKDGKGAGKGKGNRG